MIKKPKINIFDCIAYAIMVIYFAFFLLFMFTSNFKDKGKIIPDNPFVASLFIQIEIIFTAIIISILQKVKINKLSAEGNLLKKETEVMVTCGYYIKDDWKEAKRRALDAQKQFLQWWLGIWVFWLPLYIMLLLKELKPSDDSIFSYLLNPLNNLNSLMLLICYLVLAEITTDKDGTGITLTPHWAPWVSLFLFITFLEIMTKLFFANSSVPNNFAGIFDWINGITSGAVMALFVGKFDTDFIKRRFLYLFFLYLYMAIQAIYPVFMNYCEVEIKIMNFGITSIKLFISITTLVCKIILFLFVYDLINSRGLLFYFVRIRKLHYGVKDQWKDFLEKNSFIKQTVSDDFPGIPTEEKRKIVRKAVREKQGAGIRGQW